MKYPLLPLLSVIALLAGCQTMDERPSQRLGEAAMQFADGSPAGIARLIGSGGRVDVSVALAGVTPGQHRLRLHATGACNPPDFRSAGEPLADRDMPSGRLPDAIINQSGSGTISAALADVGDQVLARIFDADGTAIVLHDGLAGDSRIACGVFTQD